MLEFLRRWLVGDMGIAGDFQYQSMHFYTILAVGAGCIMAYFAGVSRKLDQKQKRKILYMVAVFQLGFEIFWRLVFWLVRGDSLASWWPCYPCNVGGILLPIIALTDWEKGKKMFYLFGFVGGVVTFAAPDDIFCRDVMVFPILKSVLQHTGLLLIPILEYAMDTFRPTLKHMSWVTV